MGISKFEKYDDQGKSQDGDAVQKKKYDLEERSERFSIRIIDFCLRLKRDTINVEYIRQLVRSGHLWQEITWKQMKILAKAT